MPLTTKKTQTTQKDQDIRRWKSRSFLGQEQKGGGVKPVNGIPLPDTTDINK